MPRKNLDAADDLDYAVSTDATPLPRGKVYFEVAIDGSLPGALRQKLSLAAYARIQELDPDGLRGVWQRLEHVQNDPAKMPDFIRTRCLYPLGGQSRMQDCLVTHDDPPATNYCYDDTTRICYHPFTLVNPDTGLPLTVHASWNGQEAAAPILLVLAWESDPIFPAGATYTDEALARFQAHEVEKDPSDAVTAWPDSFAPDRSAAPVDGTSAGRLRRSGARCWVDFRGGDVLACDLGAGLAADYTLMIVLRPGEGSGRCEVFGTGTADAGISVTVERDDAKWTITARHATPAGTVKLAVELPAAGQYRVFTLSFDRENGLCAFVDDERIPRQAAFTGGPGTGSNGEARIGCRVEAGEPQVSIGEVLLFREPVWEETRLAVARYLKINYRG